MLELFQNLEVNNIVLRSKVTFYSDNCSVF